MIKRINWVNCAFNGDDIDENDDEDSEYKDSYDENPIGKLGMGMAGKFIQTPLGISSITEKMSPLGDTEFYAAYTTFSITTALALDIEKVEGVEYLKVYGRYRFIVGFGTMFDVESVIESIESLLGVDNSGYDINPIKKKIDEYIITTSGNKVTKWVAYVFPNGKYQVLACRDDEEMLKNRELAKELQGFSNGLIVTSED